MVDGFARYSVSYVSHIARPKKTAAGAVSRKQGLLRQAGWRAWEDAAKKRRATKIFSLPMELKSGMAVEECASS